MSAFDEAAMDGMSEPSATALGKRGRGGEDADDAQQAARQYSPEPDEDLDLAQGRHPVWLVKVPKFILQAWSSIHTDDLRLGTVRVYDPDHTGHQRMELLLPDSPQPPIPTEPGKPRNPQWETIPRAYDLKLTANSDATLHRNIYAFQERLEEVEPAAGSASKTEIDSDDDDDDDDDGDGSGNKRRKRVKTKRITALRGTITNEAALQPQIRAPNADVKPGSSSFGGAAPISDSYRELLRKRRQEASTPKRTIKMLDSSDAGRHNMLVAGVGSGLINQKSRFNAAIAQKPKSSGAASGSSASNEKFARMPKNELLDLLFNLFERWQYWSLKKLRAETQQPESYLREVLTGIADLHKRGPYVGNWSLKPEYSNLRKEQEKSQQEQQSQAASQQPPQSQPKKNQNDEEDEDFGEDDSDDDDDEDDFDDV
ncbi:hypothetical protein BCV70DRAFT_197963 [Testicularia cyperi]|uniref:Transcription initiation factor IIF subunit beta n=1 Tax=Testicularia cyperi TaxID=1882483 RepID=A0A317XZQ0_9BASI|nr:hypothetical protein BCV70DRAFT_197963 [Testicularia cyperi]